MSGPADSGHGVLDTSAVIRLGRFTNANVLRDEPLITAVTLAELSVGPVVAHDERERAARQAHLQQARPTSTRCPSMPPLRERSDRSPPRCDALAARPRPAPTTR